MDSECSRHMTENSRKFTTIKYKDNGIISFDNSGQLKVMGIGNIKFSSNFVINKCCR